MSSSAPPGFGKPLGLLANAAKRKDSFIQFAAMTGILLLSIRSLSQKYRIHDLQEDTSALKQEQQNLTNRLNHIERGLRHEASLDPTGLFASRLRILFGEEDSMWVFFAECPWGELGAFLMILNNLHLQNVLEVLEMLEKGTKR